MSMIDQGFNGIKYSIFIPLDRLESRKGLVRASPAQMLHVHRRHIQRITKTVLSRVRLALIPVRVHGG